MTNDLSARYAQLSDDEVLQLVSERATLSEEASRALDAEMRDRGLSTKDVAAHEKAVRHAEQREIRNRRRKLRGGRPTAFSLVEVWPTMVLLVTVFALGWLGYAWLPRHYHLRPDWESAVIPMLFSAGIIVGALKEGWKTFLYWLVLAISSTLQVLIAHRYPRMFSGWNRLGVFLGMILFFGVGYIALSLRRLFQGTTGERLNSPES